MEAMRSKMDALQVSYDREVEGSKQLKSNLADALEYVKNAKAELNSRKEMLEKAEKDLEEKKAQFDALKNDADSFMMKAESSENELADLTAQLSAARAENESTPAAAGR